MSDIRVLNNPTIHDLLINLSQDEAIEFRRVVEKTFEEFSTGGERRYQPGPGVVNRPNGQNTLFRPFTSDSSVGTKITVDPAPDLDGRRDPLHGVIVLCDGKGNLTGVMNSEEITGYRISMNAMVPFCWRNRAENIIIFGTGVQALWHTRLIITLRGSDVKTITYVSPRSTRADRLIETVTAENRTYWKADCSFHFIDNAAADSQQKIESALAKADSIFCTTPSNKPLFPAHYLDKKRSSAPFISAIGSWQPEMIELDPALLRRAVASDSGNNPMTGKDEGMILTDDRDFALTNSGELIQSKIAAKDIVEVGEIIGLRNGKGKPAALASTNIQKTDRLLSEGFVIYKSVGVSLTDLTVSNAILELARRRQRTI
ncbi:Proline utilization protein PrnX [Aspergillus sclerotialis]|uniref:Proline utilization protein PrnX n=1 Tax=Aspergillus sclerotialis TaxID=2070753 RepID=A0A3A3A2H6_9EURO|nr:Proline utilization protein PrnX [Aspergillus sclerotialis]